MKKDLYGSPMKTNLKRKNYYLDEKKIRRVRAILGAKTETEAIDTALNRPVAIKELQPLFNGEHSVLMEDGTKLTLSRNYKEKLFELLGKPL